MYASTYQAFFNGGGFRVGQEVDNGNVDLPYADTWNVSLTFIIDIIMLCSSKKFLPRQKL